MTQPPKTVNIAIPPMTGKGARLFIPAEFIGWWPQVMLEVSGDRKTITLKCTEKPKGKKR